MLKAPVYRNAHGRAAMLLCRLAGTAALLVGAQMALAQNTTEPATPDHACAEDQYKALGGSSTLSCNANDLVVSASAVINNNTVGACPNDGLVHQVDILAFHKMRRPPVTLEQVLQFLMGHTRKNRRVVDLVPVQIEDR